MGILSQLPVWEADPFLALRPFPTQATNNFMAHWHEIVGAFVAYVLVQRYSRPWARKYFGSAYTELLPRTQLNFDIHLVSMFQCILSILMCGPMWNHPFRLNHAIEPHNAIFGYTPYAGLVAAVTIGYFVWDIYVCIRYFLLFGWGFLFHGVAAGYVFVCALGGFCMPWMPAFLLFELSTPFVNINWFASHLPEGTISNAVVMINGLLLLVVFFFVRLVWGVYAVWVVAHDMVAVGLELDLLLPLLILPLNIMLNALNVFWFYKMVKIAKRKAGALKRPKREKSG